MSDYEQASRIRLVAVLKVLAASLCDFCEKCRFGGEMPADFLLPGCLVNSNDVTTAAHYLTEFGLGSESGRLRTEYDHLTSRFFGEVLVIETWKNPAEGTALQKWLDFSIRAMVDEADYARLLQTYQYGAIGAATCMLETVRGILDALGASQPRIQVSIDPPQIVIDGNATALDEQAAIYLSAIVSASGQWVSGEEISRQNSLFDGSKVSRVWSRLPKDIQGLIERTPGKGSRFTQLQ